MKQPVTGSGDGTDGGLFHGAFWQIQTTVLTIDRPTAWNGDMDHPRMPKTRLSRLKYNEDRSTGWAFWIVSLHYLVKLEVLIAHVLYNAVVRQRNSRIYCNLNCGLQIRQIWIQLITACGKYFKRGVQNMHDWSAAIDEVINEWMPQWRHDPAWSTPFSVAVSVHPDQWCMFCTPSLAVFPHTVINKSQIWRIWRPQ